MKFIDQVKFQLGFPVRIGIEYHEKKFSEKYIGIVSFEDIPVKSTCYPKKKRVLRYPFEEYTEWWIKKKTGTHAREEFYPYELKVIMGIGRGDLLSPTPPFDLAE